MDQNLLPLLSVKGAQQLLTNVSTMHVLPRCRPSPSATFLRHMESIRLQACRVYTRHVAYVEAPRAKTHPNCVGPYEAVRRPDGPMAHGNSDHSFTCNVNVIFTVFSIRLSISGQQNSPRVAS